MSETFKRLSQVQPAVFLLIMLALGGCSSESLKRFAFDLGDQYSCSNANEDHVYESVKDLECSGASERASYDDFAAARAAELESE